MTSKTVEQFLHGVPKTGMVTECFKSDISQTIQNLNNYEPKLRISFQINMANIRYISNSEKKVGEKKTTATTTVEPMHLGTFNS